MQTTLSTGSQSSSSTSTAISSAAGATATDADLFTKLLVAQIRNQNPLEPTDPNEFVRQLSMQSQTEALKKLADQGTANAAMLSSIQMLALGAQVGSQVTVQSDKVTLSGAPIQIGFALANTSVQNTLVLTASDGSEKRIELGSQKVGNVSYTLDPAKLGLANGSYSMQVVTAGTEKPALEVTGKLASVQLTSAGGALLNVIGAGPATPSQITRFNG